MSRGRGTRRAAPLWCEDWWCECLCRSDFSLPRPFLLLPRRFFPSLLIGVLGALLVFVGIEMARYSRTDSLAITCLIGILALLSSMTIAFIVGLVIAYLLAWISRRREENKYKSSQFGHGCSLLLRLFVCTKLPEKLQPFTVLRELFPERVQEGKGKQIVYKKREVILSRWRLPLPLVV